MAISTAMCSSFKKESWEAIHNLKSSGGNAFKIALYSSAATLGASTTAYSTTNELATAGGYTQGGTALTNNGVTIGTPATTAFADFADPSWGSATFTANGCLIYNDTAAGDPAVGTYAFGGDKSVSGGTFSITMPAADGTNAVLRFA